MRKLLTLIAAALILAGSYYIAFGVPEQLEEALGITSNSADTAGPQAGARQGGPGGGPGGPGGGRGGSRGTTVVMTPLELRPYEDILRAIGSASALRSADVISNAAGEVVQTNLTPNQQVAVGDVLVQLDARTQAFNLEIAQTEFDQAKGTVERYERLKDSGNSTITEVTLSEARVAQRLAEAKVGLAQVALDDRTIRAPIAGKLGLSDIAIGDTLTANSTVVTIDESQALLVEFELPERSVSLLARTQEVLANTPSFVGRTFTGEIVAFDSRIDSVTRSVTVKARIENPDGLLWPGMTFAVRIIYQSDPLAVLPATAITWSRDGSSVWVDRDGAAQPTPATILFRRGDNVWIEADIAPGTMVVTEGAQKLRAGSAIKDAGAATSKPARQDTPAQDIGQAEPQAEPPVTSGAKTKPEEPT